DQQNKETQRTYTKDLENEETWYIKNSNNTLDITVIAKLIAIVTMSTNDEEQKRANTEDKRFQEKQDRVIEQVFEQQDKNNLTRTLPKTGELSTKRII
ncbi:5551_t:CDS:2, partial [Racocetra fulgida]